jgi:hypothetical protein
VSQQPSHQKRQLLGRIVAGLISVFEHITAIAQKHTGS